MLISIIKTEESLPPLSRSLLLATYGRTSPADIVQILAKPSTSLDTIADVLLGVLGVMEKPIAGSRGIWVRELLGIALEVYKRVFVYFPPIFYIYFVTESKPDKAKET